MPLAVVGTGLKDASAAAVRASGKLRVHIQGNVHAGEVEGKESAQILLREFAMGQHKDWLQSMVFLITPIFNADGNEKIDKANRTSQKGPPEGVDIHANAAGFDLNRDFVKRHVEDIGCEVKQAFDGGERDAATLEAIGVAALDVDRVDYLEVLPEDTLSRDEGKGPWRVFVAAFVGRTRLIDNLALGAP